MINFFKEKVPATSEALDASTEEDGCAGHSSHEAIASGFAAAEAARSATQTAAKKFAKPAKYTGNRNLYDDGAAKRRAKTELFKQGATVRDPYTGDKLVLTKKEAKLLYGEDWTQHLAEADHIKPLEQIYADTVGSPWVTTDNVKTAANSQDNLRVTSRSTNNAKRSRTNKQYVEDREYRERKGIEFTPEGEQAALRDGEAAERSLRRQFLKASAQNIVETGHEAGLSGAQDSGITAGTMSGIMNTVAVIKGEKDVDEAIADTVKDAGQAAVTGYAMSGGLTVVSHSLSNSNSQFIQSLIKSNIPGTVITAVSVMGNTLMRYGKGEITTQECIIELGERGLDFATTGYSMAVGQALIPIPVVGSAIGALVGSALTSNYYHVLISALQQKDLEHQERLRIIAECREAAEQTKAFRLELESYLRDYFKEYQGCFDAAISSMQFSFQTGDADGIIAGANQITAKLGGTVHYETVKEFAAFFDSTDIDVI